MYLCKIIKRFEMKRAKSHILIILIMFLVPMASKATVLSNISTITVEDSAKINKLLIDAKVFEEKKDYQRAVEMALSAMDLSEKVKFEYGKYKSYKALEILYRDAGKPMLSAKYKLKAINSQVKLEEINYERDEKEKLEKIEKEKRKVKSVCFMFVLGLVLFFTIFEIESTALIVVVEPISDSFLVPLLSVNCMF